MRRPSFLEGVLLALLLAALAGVGATVLPPLIGMPAAARLLVTVLAGLYVIHLMRRSREKTGRVTVACVWLAATLVGWWLLPIGGLVLAEVILLSLIRTVYFEGDAVSALFDIGVSALALAVAAWAFASGSWALTVWTFFLVQALSAWVPGSTRVIGRSSGDDRDFAAARSLAESALERLATRH